MAFTVTSNSFKDGDYLGKDHILSENFGFGCAGGNKSPHLKWSGAPAGTKSFAVTCFDPDAPTGSGFWHWVVVNIPADVTELALDAGNPKSGSMPAGALMTRTELGQQRLSRPVPAGGRPPAPLSVHGVRGRQRQARRYVRHLAGGGRLQPAFQHAGARQRSWGSTSAEPAAGISWCRIRCGA